MKAVSRQWSVVSKRVFYLALCAMLLALCPVARAQQTKKMARIGYLRWLSGTSPTLPAFKEGLRELGWVEGKEIEIDYRYAGNDDKLSELRPNWFALKWTSSSLRVVTCLRLQRSVRQQQSLL